MVQRTRPQWLHNSAQVPSVQGRSQDLAQGGQTKRPRCAPATSRASSKDKTVLKVVMEGWVVYSMGLKEALNENKEISRIPLDVYVQIPNLGCTAAQEGGRAYSISQ